jgi:hypothetical protein
VRRSQHLAGPVCGVPVLSPLRGRDWVAGSAVLADRAGTWATAPAGVNWLGGFRGAVEAGRAPHAGNRRCFLLEILSFDRLLRRARLGVAAGPACRSCCRSRSGARFIHSSRSVRFERYQRLAAAERIRGACHRLDRESSTLDGRMSPVKAMTYG